MKLLDDVQKMVLSLALRCAAERKSELDREAQRIQQELQNEMGRIAEKLRGDIRQLADAIGLEVPEGYLVIPAQDDAALDVIPPPPSGPPKEAKPAKPRKQ